VERANQLDGSQWLKNSFSVWRHLLRDRDSRQHPAPFPVELVSKIIDCYVADAEGLLLDPFAGSGSALLAALRKGMNAIGFDINPEYRALFLSRLELFYESRQEWTYEIQDARVLSEFVEPGSVEICVTSPPYWDILTRRRSADGKSSRPYSTNGHDLGNINDYDSFLSALGNVAFQVEVALRSRGYFILNIMDLRKGSKFYPLHSDAILAVTSTTRMTLEDIVIWDRQSDYNAMRLLGYISTFIINKVHEYLLIFRKEGSKNARQARTTG